jgi:hypothetical protein
MIETKVYVGLNDADTLEQKFETKKYISILRSVCFSYRVPFSFSVMEGGYFHENGDFTEENTLALSFFDVEREVVEEIARDTDRDNYMTAKEALEYGLIDKIFEKRA